MRSHLLWQSLGQLLLQPCVQGLAGTAAACPGVLLLLQLLAQMQLRDAS